eukprot:350930-Chlamydomonas_euryale.AAC.1
MDRRAGARSQHRQCHTGWGGVLAVFSFAALDGIRGAGWGAQRVARGDPAAQVSQVAGGAACFGGWLCGCGLMTKLTKGKPGRVPCNRSLCRLRHRVTGGGGHQAATPSG